MRNRKPALLTLAICALLLTACNAVPAETETTTLSLTTTTLSTPISTSPPDTTPPDTAPPETAAPETEPPRAFFNDSGKEIPNGVQGVLKGMFFTLGEAENRFAHFDYAPYFVGGAENESCRYYTAQSTYYSNFRREEFDPVFNLRQSISVADYKEENGGIFLTAEHSMRFSYTHIETNSASSTNYELILKPFGGDGWRIESLRCTNNWFETEYRGKMDVLEQMAAMDFGPRSLQVEEGLHVPPAVTSLLKEFLFSMGEAEYHFMPFDYTPYFVGGAENESSRYYTAQSTYLSGLRRKSHNPVLRFRQSIFVTEYAEEQNGVLLTLSFSRTFTAADEEEFFNTAQDYAQYHLVLKPAGKQWRIESMRCSEEWANPLEKEYRGKIDELEKLTAEQIS